MLIRVLIINRQLVFAVTIKQALEQTGAFEVHPFTDPNAAMEYLRTNPHDVALVDFAITVMPGPEIVERLRLIQPDIAVIVSPVQSDSNRVIRDLSLQGMVDAPFSARGIIPVIEHAVEQMAMPSQAITRSFVDGDDSGAIDTEILNNPRSEQPPQRPPDVPADTRILSEQDAGPTAQPSDTIILDDEAGIVKQPPSNVDQAPVVHEPTEAEPADTRLLNDPPDEPADTRMLPEGAPDTRILDDQQSPPPTLPEFSSLGNVLNDEAPSSLYEPPVKDDDTPSVPDVDSDAVRQYLATSDKPSDFESMLGEIAPDDQSEELPQLPAASREFDDLVNSMKASREHKPLPDRHQQFVEFILTGGMDGLLSEIEQTKTGPLEEEGPEKPPSLPEQPPPSKMVSTFEKLAAEEPPMPTLEESGTIGDLMIGVSDTSFRNVLAMMRDEEELEETTGEQSPVSREEIEAAYATFFEEQIAAPAYEDVDEVDEDVPPPTVPEVDETPSIPAQLILETTEDDSTPVDSFSINSLLGSIEQQLHEHKPDIQPLPSWQGKPRKRRRARPAEERPQLKPPPKLSPPADERFVQEPDFLPEMFQPEVEDVPAEQAIVDDTADTSAHVSTEQAIDAPVEISEEALAELGRDLFDAMQPSSEVQQSPMLDEAQWLDDDDQATVMGGATVGAEPTEEFPAETPSPAANIEWDDLAVAWDSEPSWDDELDEPDVEAEPPPSLPDFEDDWELTVDEVADEATVMLERAELAEQPVELGAGADFEPELATLDVVADTDDPYIAQIALSLTQVSLELAAEATLLTNAEAIVAIAGDLASDEIEELRSSIADDWDANPDEARIRFITLASSGRDYMLYTRKTVGDFTLTMIFAGTTALRDIRRQGRRLLDALASVPEVPPEPIAVPEIAPPPVAVEPEVRLPYTYLWLLRDPDSTFNAQTSRTIRAALDMQLNDLGWDVHDLQAQGEYVYVRADVPGERPAYEIIEDLKQRTASLVQAGDASNLWADSYLVMMPGRDLDPDEISQFITFERML